MVYFYRNAYRDHREKLLVKALLSTVQRTQTGVRFFWKQMNTMERKLCFRNPEKVWIWIGRYDTIKLRAPFLNRSLTKESFH